MSALKGMKVDKTLNLNMMALKVSIEMIMCLLRVEALYREMKRVKKTLKSDALNGLSGDLRGVTSH